MQRCSHIARYSVANSADADQVAPSREQAKLDLYNLLKSYK